MSSMENKFNTILKQYGHDVYLQRRVETAEGEVSYHDTLEIHTTRYSIFSPRSLPNAKQEQMEGIVATSERVYYFKKDVNPYDGDRIYEEEFSPEKSVWVIDQVTPMRGTGGTVVYWAVGCTKIRSN
jgi:hypothetical protein